MAIISRRSQNGRLVTAPVDSTVMSLQGVSTVTVNHHIISFVPQSSAWTFIAFIANLEESKSSKVQKFNQISIQRRMKLYCFVIHHCDLPVWRFLDWPTFPHLNTTKGNSCVFFICSYINDLTLAKYWILRYCRWPSTIEVLSPWYPCLTIYHEKTIIRWLATDDS